jgi:hypothetical protein
MIRSLLLLVAAAPLIAQTDSGRVLDTLRVRDRVACRISSSDGKRVVGLWEKARSAFSTTRADELSGTLELQVVEMDGHVDDVKFIQDPPTGPWERGLHPEADTAHARSFTARRAFATTPADTLLTRGYIRRRSDGTFVFDAPNAELLLSDAFAARTCFELEDPPRDQPQWIGIRFTPRASEGERIDARGVLWLDRESGELRRLDFAYTNLPKTDFEICDPQPDRRHYNHEGPICQTFRDGSKLDLGGTIEFAKLSDGKWIANRWTLRTPPDEGIFRRVNRLRQVGPRDWVRCQGPGKGCTELWAQWPRLVTTTGHVASVMRSGVEIYRDAAAQSLVAAASRARNAVSPPK